jgi:hypothetical protein
MADKGGAGEEVTEPLAEDEDRVAAEEDIVMLLFWNS